MLLCNKIDEHKRKIYKVNTINLIYDLFNHMCWADALMWESVLKTPSAIQDRTIFEQLHHIHLCQHAWLLIWQEGAVDPNAGTDFDLLALKQWGQLYHKDVMKYLESVQESDLDKLINVPTVDEILHLPSLRETFIQITTHSTYHRGQLMKYLRSIGGIPSQTDFIKWVFLGKPIASWSCG